MSNGWAVAYENGWNQVVRAAAARGELDSVSLRHKVRTLDGVKAAFGADAGSPLSADAVACDLGRRFEVRAQGSYVEVRRADRDGWETTLVDAQDAHVLFADGGTTLLLRESGGGQDRFTSIDLPSRRMLQRWTEQTGSAPST
jgi:hypothetical protein